MNENLFKNEVDEDNEIDSRRKFLKQIMYGSLLALSGSEIANATVRDTIHLRGMRPTDRPPPQKTYENHA